MKPEQIRTESAEPIRDQEIVKILKEVDSDALRTIFAEHAIRSGINPSTMSIKPMVLGLIPERTACSAKIVRSASESTSFRIFTIS